MILHDTTKLSSLSNSAMDFVPTEWLFVVATEQRDLDEHYSGAKRQPR